MKRVKVQERQHTILVSDIELDCILDAIQFYSTSHPSETLKDHQECYFYGENPYLDVYNDLSEDISDALGKDDEGLGEFTID